MNSLIVRNLYMQYNFSTAGVRNISFEAKQGEILTVLAPLEGGKTTLIKSIAGLNPIQKGEAELNGKILNNLPTKDRNIAVIYEDWGLFNHKTVFYNLMYPLKIRNTEPQTALDTVNRVLEEFNLVEFRDKKIGKLSEEEKFRAALARVFCREAELYLIDDPLYTFKGEERQRLFGYFLPYLKKLSVTAPIVYATSSVGEAKRLGGKTVLLNYGFQLQSGTIDEIAENPSTILALRLFHDDAIIEETIIIESDGGVFVEYMGQKIPVDPDKLLNRIYIGSEVFVCFLNGKKGNILKLYDKSSEKLIYFV